MPELTLDDVTLDYDQSGDGPDIVWLAAGDHPGSNWRRWQVPAFEPGWRNTTYDARAWGGPGRALRRHGRSRCTPPISRG